MSRQPIQTVSRLYADTQYSSIFTLIAVKDAFDAFQTEWKQRRTDEDYVPSVAAIRTLREVIRNSSGTGPGQATDLSS